MVEEIFLVDVAHPASASGQDDSRVHRISGDVTEPAALAPVSDSGNVSIFHQAAKVSAACEADFGGAMQAELDGAGCSRSSALPSCPRLGSASSIAAYGGLAAAGRCGDCTKLTLETTYGTLKAVGELL